MIQNLWTSKSYFWISFEKRRFTKSLGIHNEIKHFFKTKSSFISFKSLTSLKTALKNYTWKVCVLPQQNAFGRPFSLKKHEEMFCDFAKTSGFFGESRHTKCISLHFAQGNTFCISINQTTSIYVYFTWHHLTCRGLCASGHRHAEMTRGLHASGHRHAESEKPNWVEFNQGAFGITTLWRWGAGATQQRHRSSRWDGADLQGATSVGPSRRGESLGHLGWVRSTIGGSSSGRSLKFVVVWYHVKWWMVVWRRMGQMYGICHSTYLI